MNSLRRHTATAVLSGLIVPPTASALLLATALLPASKTWADPASAVASFLTLFYIFAVPVGYVFGTVPALLAGLIYSRALTAVPTVCPRPLLRAVLGAACGGLAGEVWFYAVIGNGSGIYAAAAAVTMTLFALWRTDNALDERRSAAESLGLLGGFNPVRCVKHLRGSLSDEDPRCHGVAGSHAWKDARRDGRPEHARTCAKRRKRVRPELPGGAQVTDAGS
jgi:hypothetical protein